MALRLTQATRIVGDCDAEEGGYCNVLECRENLTGEVLRSGSYWVAPIPGRKARYLPQHRTRSRTVTPEVRALWSDDDDAITDAVVARQDWLVERYGSVCWHDVRKVLGEDATREQLGELWQVTRQCVEQWTRRGEAVLRGALGDTTDVRPV